jgi:arabinogalactan endo-1,4-beta-galactosidase
VLVEDDVRSWDRRFEQIQKRYRDFAGIALSELPSWDQVLHAQELRNALVHNQGQYTRAYLRTKLTYRPTEEDLHGFAPSADDAGLIDHEVTPLSLTLADAVIAQLRAAATEVREAIGPARRN